MYARVATFEGETRDEQYQEQIDQIRSQVESGARPPGLEDAKGVLILSEKDGGKRLAITLLDDEEGMRRGDGALNNMPVGMGQRASVDFYEVVVQNMS
jgi:hypothetical protein